MSNDEQIRRLFDLWYGIVPEEPSEVTQKQVALLREKASPSPNAAILDLGCGTGRHLQRLEKLGFANLCGVDFSRSAIAIAESKTPSGHVQYACEPFEEFLKRNPCRFDLIYSFDCTSSLYAPPEFRESLVQIHKSLKSEGQCFMELWNPVPPLLQDKLSAEREYELPAGTLRYKAQFVPERGIIVLRHRLTGKDGAVMYLPEQLQYVYSFAELESLARDSGFRQCLTYGGDSSLMAYALLRK
jgi:SAM-dependent methyltransferase